MKLEDNYKLSGAFEATLANCNEFMQLLTKKVDRSIRQISADDFDVINRYYGSESSVDLNNHGNTFTYLIQMMSQIGAKEPKIGYAIFAKDYFLPMIAYPRKENDDKFSFFFIRPTGRYLSKVLDLVSQIRTINQNIPIYLKKIHKKDADFFLKNGFGNIQDMPWHTMAIAEDDTFEEVILEAQNTLNAMNIASKKTRLGKAAREAKHLTKHNNVVVSNLWDPEIAWHITNTHFKSIKKKLNISKAEDYRQMIFNNPQRVGLTKSIIYVNNEPQGFYILEALPGSDTNNLYALITLRDKYRSLADYAIRYICTHSDYKYINLGGSEDIDIHRFKLKFAPIKLQSMEWLVAT